MGNTGMCNRLENLLPSNTATQLIQAENVCLFREGSGYRGTGAMPYSFSNDPSGSFTCPVHSTDKWDLGLKSHTNDMVWWGIELTTPGL